MSYIALYRSYRPKSFSDVAGQEVIVQTLKNAVLNNKIGHAYLFSGPRGTGKTSLAKIFAKTINCANLENGNPCNKCEPCLSFSKNEANDIIEIDGASNNGVDEIRDIRDKVNYLPSVGKYKVYIIDEVHMLTTGAFNALLKTLEEPPAHVVFILATTEVHKIPATILSRCQRYDFKNITIENIVSRLEYVIKEEKIQINDDAIKLIAYNAMGGLRDALSLLDQAVSFTNKDITSDDINQILGTVSNEELIELITLLNDSNVTKALQLVKSFLDKGKDEERIINDLITNLKDLLLAKVGINNDPLYLELKDKLSNNKIYHYIDCLISIQNNMRHSYQKRIYLEIGIIQMVEHDEVHQIDLSSSILELRKEIEEIKSKGVKVASKVTTVTNDNKPLVLIENIENVLYEANVETKDYLINLINNVRGLSTNLEMAHYLLKDSILVAASNDSVIFTNSNLAIASQLMQRELYDNVLEILNKESNDIKSYYVILDSDWVNVRSKYVELFKSNQKRPKLGNYDFKIYETIVNKNTDLKEKESVRLAKEYFGENIVEIKE